MYFPIPIPENWPANLSWHETAAALDRVNLSPLYFLEFPHRESTYRWLIRDFVINTIMTIPLGYGLGYFRKPGFLKLLLWVLGIGVVFEGVQILVILITGVFYHTVDINDVIFNALGVLLGWLVYRMISKPSKGIQNPELSK